MIQPGDRVQILYPEYAVGETGVVLEQETLQDGSKTGYWLVRTDDKDMILALLPQEMKVLSS
ncbi:hypothetical protein N836_05755 [Leptolyngbya sp. Heron Island J]|nr:hypothetical protein N836_05755 [Leptolyngbya sp. Heron Island J]